MTIDDCLFEGNPSGGFGAGAYVSSQGVLRNSVFVNNQTNGDGAGLMVVPNAMFSKSMTIDNVLLINNQAGGDGGGMAVQPVYANVQQPMILRGLTVSGNTAKGKGGGMLISGEVVSVSHSIVWANSDGASGGNSGDEVFLVGNPSAKITFGWMLCNGDEGKFGDPGLKANGGNGYATGADGNTQGDLLFVAGPKGGWYLSQVAAGQGKNSVAVDPVGGAAAAGFAWGNRTTRTDGKADGGALDMGWHWLP